MKGEGSAVSILLGLCSVYCHVSGTLTRMPHPFWGFLFIKCGPSCQELFEDEILHIQCIVQWPGT